MDEDGSDDGDLAVHAGRQDRGDRRAGVHGRQLVRGETEALAEQLRSRLVRLRRGEGVQRQGGGSSRKNGGRRPRGGPRHHTGRA